MSRDRYPQKPSGFPTFSATVRCYVIWIQRHGNNLSHWRLYNRNNANKTTPTHLRHNDNLNLAYQSISSAKKAGIDFKNKALFMKKTQLKFENSNNLQCNAITADIYWRHPDKYFMFWSSKPDSTCPKPSTSMGHVTLVAITGTIKPAPYLLVNTATQIRTLIFMKLNLQHPIFNDMT